jgi:hypothetical protein
MTMKESTVFLKHSSLIVGVMIVWFIQGCTIAHHKPSLVLREGIDPSSESCYVYAWLEVDGQPTHKLCGGRNLSQIGSYAFINKMGGNAAGWGLYRYNEKTKRLVLHDFNARQIEITRHDHEGIALNVAYAVHNPDGGYDPDRIEHWVWPHDKAIPIEVK